MKFRFACGDIEPGCEATFENADRDSLLEEAVGHARETHHRTDFSPEFMAVVDQRVRAVAS